MLHPLVLAFVGDAVHELWLKTELATHSDAKAGSLHKTAGKLLSAKEQSIIAEKLKDFFDDEEKEIFRRARNCHNNTSAKNATLDEYKKATGLEAVLGYRFLIGDTDRAENILKAAYGIEENL